MPYIVNICLHDAKSEIFLIYCTHLIIEIALASKRNQHAYRLLRKEMRIDKLSLCVSLVRAR